LTDAPVVFDRLTHYYGSFRAVHDLTLAVPRGSVFALLGRNGAGKTTAMQCLLGFLRPTRGRVRVLGHDALRLPPALRNRIGHVAEGQVTLPWMRIEQLVAFQDASFRQFDDELCRGYLHQLGLKSRRRVRSLSRGQAAQVALALALAQRPDVVILDDPGMGLDAVVRREFLEVMIDLVQEEGNTLLFTSHILTDVERVADRVAILDQGVLRVCGPLEEVRARIQRVRGTFDGQPPRVPQVDGLIRGVRRRREITLTVGRDVDGAARRLRELGALEVVIEDLSLEDLFIDYTAGAPVAGESA
jgi:ABC-2 type transport system ATP-binding protein